MPILPTFPASTCRACDERPAAVIGPDRVARCGPCAYETTRSSMRTLFAELHQLDAEDANQAMPQSRSA